MKQDSLSKTVKLVGTKRFEVALMERYTGEYYIEYTLGINQVGMLQTKDIKDYKLASDTFNTILSKLEGN